MLLPQPLRLSHPEVPDPRLSWPVVAAYNAATGPPHPLPPLLNPPCRLPASATAMSFQKTKNLMFRHDTQNIFCVLVDSDASLSILPHSPTELPTGRHLVGAMAKPFPLRDSAKFWFVSQGKF